MRYADIPNIISILRIIMVLPIVVLLLKENYSVALILFAVAGISDALDGYIAKQYNFVSRLGTILDPLADKLLLISTYMVLAWLELLPLWLVITVLARDLFIFIGALAYHYLIGQYEMKPTLISKINTFSQIVLGLAVVLSMSVLPFPLLILFVDWLIYMVLATTLLSGADYIWTWGIRALHTKSGRHYG